MWLPCLFKGVETLWSLYALFFFSRVLLPSGLHLPLAHDFFLHPDWSRYWTLYRRPGLGTPGRSSQSNGCEGNKEAWECTRVLQRKKGECFKVLTAGPLIWISCWCLGGREADFYILKLSPGWQPHFCWEATLQANIYLITASPPGPWYHIAHTCGWRSTVRLKIDIRTLLLTSFCLIYFC